MRKFSKILSWLTMILTLCSVQAFALGAGEGYYLAFDDYRFRQPNADDATFSSYDSNELGGSVFAGAVSDTSDAASVEMQREFNPVYDDAVFEIGVIIKDFAEGGSINLRCGDVDAVTMKIINGKLTLVTPRGNTELFTDDSFYGIRIVADVITDTYTLQLNGKTIASNTPFLNKVDYLDKYYITTSDEDTGTFECQHFRIYTDYLVNEWFLSTHKAVPDDWKQIGKGVSVSNENISVPRDEYGLLIDDGSFVSETGVSKDFSYESEGLWLEYQFFTDGTISDFGSTLSSAGNDIIRIGANNKEYGYWKDGEFTSLYTMKPKLWYTAQIKIKNGSAQIYLNRKLLAEGVLVSEVKADNVRFTIGASATGKGYMDRLTVKELNPLPADYVPKPVIPEKNGDYLIGMQSCSLWREGSQMGWDFVNGDDVRKPYLGFYDEGSSEVADWEIKWLVEHGVDFQMYCWFRQGSTNQPINAPVQGWALNDGFMNSEYGDMLDFVIMWENQNATGVDGMDDWKTNLVPYWMEWYFKDPRYLVVDNKPVVAFYYLDKLVTNFGSLDGVKEALEYLDAACREEGFDGVYILFSTSSRDPEYQKKIAYVGADAIFSYTAKSANVEGQKAQFIAQNNTGVIPAIASPGMGWDNSAWGINNRVGWNTKKEQLEIMTWLRDEFMPKQTGFAKNMLTIDNWNELAEGHWYYPTNLVGFDYLDAIREVFTTNPDHEDAVPTAEAQWRFQHLYVQDRKEPKSSVSRMLDKEESIRASYVPFTVFDFNDGENLELEVDKQIDNLRVENGAVVGTSNDRDPSFYIHNVNLPAERIKQVRVRAKNNTGAATRFQIFFITEQDQTWSEKKSWYLEIDSSEDWIDFSMSTMSASGMTGIITDIRIDPAELVGNFEIDRIEFVGPESMHTDICVDGEDKSSWRNIIYVDDRMYVPAVEFAAMLEYKYAVTLDRKYLEMLNEETGEYFKLEIGKDAYYHEDDIYFPVRQIAEAAGYRVDWDAEKRCANVVTISDSEAVGGAEDPVGEWNFDIPGKYGTISEFGNISGQSVKKGYLSFTAATSDPVMKLTTNIVAEEKPYMNISIRNKSQGTYFQVFFETETETGWSESRSARVKISAGDKEFQSYVVDMSSCAKWKGKITSIRVDAIDATGSIMIDYMRFSDKAETKASSGTKLGANVIDGGMLADAKLGYQASDVSAKYVSDARYMGKYSLEVNSDTNNGQMRIPASIVKDGNYSFTMWVKSDTAKKIRVGFYNDTDISGTQEVSLKGDNIVWQKVSLTMSVGEFPANGIYISPDAGTVYLDNIQLYGYATNSDNLVVED